MTALRIALACSFSLATLTLALPASAQVGDGNCIVAGRISAEQRWAPRLPGLELLGQDGRAIARADPDSLTRIRQVRLTRPALLSRCDGDNELTRADDLPVQPKSEVPAAKAGPGLLAVEAVNFPKLRTSGQLVELKLAVPADRVVMLTR
jgi:hypothetical protein